MALTLAKVSSNPVPYFHITYAMTNEADRDLPDLQLTRIFYPACTYWSMNLTPPARYGSRLTPSSSRMGTCM